MKQSVFAPELVVTFAAAAWGLFWIPLRAFERQGLQPGWVTLSQFFAPLIVLLPIALWRWMQGQRVGVRRVRLGLFLGIAVALYVESVLLTDVARALILFYTMPAWATVMEVGLMGRALTRWRVAALLLSLLGLFVILAAGQSGSSALNLGDVMALLSGMVFAFGATQVRQAPGSASLFEQLFAFFLYGSLAALALALLPLAELGERPSTQLLLRLTPAFLLVSVCILIPVMAGIYWGTSRVDPGRLGILLQIEAIVGIGSAALWAGEPFGAPQAIGAVLVIGAGMMEVWGNRNQGSLRNGPEQNEKTLIVETPAETPLRDQLER